MELHAGPHRVAEDEHAVDQETVLVVVQGEIDHLLHLEVLAHGAQFLLDGRFDPDGQVADAGAAHGVKQVPVTGTVQPDLHGDEKVQVQPLHVVPEHPAEPDGLFTVLGELVVDDEEIARPVRFGQAADLRHEPLRRGAADPALHRAELAVHAAAADPADGKHADPGEPQQAEIGKRQSLKILDVGPQPGPYQPVVLKVRARA